MDLGKKPVLIFFPPYKIMQSPVFKLLLLALDLFFATRTAICLVPGLGTLDLAL